MKKNEKRLEELENASPLRLLFKYSWPALISMSLNALYSVVDRFYIGHGCGEAAMAGMTITFPIMLFFGAFGVFVGAGHSAVLSIKLGEGDRKIGRYKVTILPYSNAADIFQYRYGSWLVRRQRNKP